jgi:hypothetical protein
VADTASAYPGVNMSRFEQAKDLSVLACCLDEMRKTEFTQEELASVAHCVDILHKLAMNMAGDRLSELYSNDAESEAPILRNIDETARMH